MLYVLQKSNLYDFRHICELRKCLLRVDSLNIVPLSDYDAEGSAFGHLVPSANEVQTILRELDQEIAVSSPGVVPRSTRRDRSTPVAI